jgi:hypothetical protein
MKFFTCVAVLTLSAGLLVSRSSSADSNAELERMYQEDQSDRESRSGEPINWIVVNQRDATRLARALELYRAGELQSGEDLYRVAMILQHGDQPEHYLLAHELCVTAVFAHGAEGGSWIRSAKWLAAASEDRFLRSIGRKQRFGTQYRSDDVEVSLEEIDGQITDSIRAQWSVPSLDEARKREASLSESALQELRNPELRPKLLALSSTDPASLTELMKIVREHGWPGADVVGFRATQTAFEILEHAPTSVQKEVVPALEKAAQTDLLTSIRGAGIVDRLRIEEGNKQLYGTAVKVEPDGTVNVLPVEDPDTLDARRAARGLPSMKEYLEQFRATKDQQAPTNVAR